MLADSPDAVQTATGSMKGKFFEWRESGREQMRYGGLSFWMIYGDVTIAPHPSRIPKDILIN